MLRFEQHKKYFPPSHHGQHLLFTVQRDDTLPRILITFVLFNRFAVYQIRSISSKRDFSCEGFLKASSGSCST